MELTTVSPSSAIVAHQLRVPLVASWHTNVHQFAARRLEKIARFLPASWRHSLAAVTERRIFDWAMRYYRIPRLILAPNRDLVSIIAKRTGKPVLLMRRGADTSLFSPSKRSRVDGAFVLGYVGRLTPEKERAISRGHRTGASAQRRS